MAVKPIRKSTKNPAILSHEFVIQNHADIVSCVAMVFVLGLMFQVTSPLASMFIAVHHNATDPESHMDAMKYTYGIKDLAAVFFYSLIAIVIHAIVQEYILDKINRKLHLSKTKHSKFNESGQLLIFTVISAVWGINILVKDNLLADFSSLWSDYPTGHAQMSFMFKFFYLIQLSYWIHSFPELYFQKVKRDEIGERVQYATIYLVFIGAAYLLNFTRVALVLLILRFVEESVLHLCRLLYFAEKSTAANTGFRFWNILFVVSRLLSIVVAILTFNFGLSSGQDQILNFETGNFNTPVIRLNALVGICLIQSWMMWSFINFHLKRMRERKAEASSSISSRKKIGEKKTKKTKKEDSKRSSDEDFNELTEVDQNTVSKLRKRK